ncbi:hypothetical protein DEO72_LG3g1413 [Vigna unguiculata]|uniref:Protein kinase domain-containing protein n=1 Tax=Vigna unguiculata TaxID=3917 RepID=A0A4D6LF82_VIGUN|nr:hypothetical protein DEO72_LG3g1413 [Vigna unguiculata]
MKVINKSKTIDVTMEPHIMSEIDTMCHLQNHPNILKIHEVLATKAKIYLFATTMTTTISSLSSLSCGHLPEPLARHSQIFPALLFYQCHDITHRNLKSQNLPLDVAGDFKVSDFDLFMLPEHLCDNLLHIACGTPTFITMEVLRCWLRWLHTPIIVP